MRNTMRRNKNNIIIYILICAFTYVLYHLFDYLPIKYSAIFSLVSFSLSFIISLALFDRIRNPFLSIVLLLYTIANVIEIQSKLYDYTDESYRIWQVGNWLVLIGFLFELDKYFEVRKKLNNYFKKNK